MDWLRARNARVNPPRDRTGFYGLDLYSLFTSIGAVIAYLDKVDPDAARRARLRYGCFEHFTENMQAYRYAAVAGIAESCEDRIVEQLVELRRSAADYASRDGRVAEDEYFHAEQNARLALNAERYYRVMFRGRALYAAIFEALGRTNWRIGAAIGIIHGLFVLAVGMPLLPGLHPRMVSEYYGPTPNRRLQPPFHKSWRKRYRPRG